MNKVIKINGVKCFQIPNRSKKGGNGTVFFYKNPKTENIYAVKVFDNTVRDAEERYNRFIREIDFIVNNCIEGVIPIIDYHKSKYNKLRKKKAYYIMPEAKPFRVDEIGKLNLKKIIEIFIDLAKTLQKLHKNGICHRDIKPENILYLNDKYCFSDFGLLWDASGDRLTKKEGERIGPYKIMPPELELVSPVDKETDFKKSDVYLLAKVLWMCLKKDNNGFRGEYNRGDDQIYIRNENNFTLEPIHLLLEEATKNNWESRITIEDFLNHLKCQLDIINKKIPKENIENYHIDENFKEIYARISPNSIVTNDVKCIYKFIDRLKKYDKFTLYDRIYSRNEKLEIFQISLNKEVIELRCMIVSKMIFLVINPQRLELNRTGSAFISLKKFDDGNVLGYQIFDYSTQNIEKSKKYILNKNFEILYNL